MGDFFKSLQAVAAQLNERIQEPKTPVKETAPPPPATPESGTKALNVKTATREELIGFIKEMSKNIKLREGQIKALKEERDSLKVHSEAWELPKCNG